VSKREHGIGFLPGNIDAKMKPWLTPVIEGLRAEVSGTTLDKWKAEGRFEIVPFEYMRGRTFENAAVILDEAQNATFDDLTCSSPGPAGRLSGDGRRRSQSGRHPELRPRQIVELAEEFDHGHRRVQRRRCGPLQARQGLGQGDRHPPPAREWGES
jgi:hypothetical protein